MLRRPSILLALFLLLGTGHAQSSAGAIAGTPMQKETSSTGSNLQGGGTGTGSGAGNSGTGGAQAPQDSEDKLPPLEPKTTGTKVGAKPSLGGGSEPRPKDAPRTPTGELDDRSAWETWWLYNRDALLDLRAPPSPSDPEATAVVKPIPHRGGVKPATVALRVLPAFERMLAAESNPELLAELLVAYARAARVERGLQSSPQTDLVQTFLAHPQAQVVEAAVLALGILGESASARTLVELARDSRAGRLACARDSVPYRVRAFAAHAAGLVAAQAPNEDVRRFVAGVLVDSAFRRDVPREVAIACVTALGLVELASDPKAWRGTFVRTAKDLEPTTARESLAAHVALLVDDTRANPVLRAHAVTAFARIARGASEGLRDAVERKCVELLAPAERTPNEVAQSAVLALAELSDAGAAPLDRDARAALMQAAREGDLDTRHFALIALGRIAARPDEDAAAPFSGTAETHRLLLRELAEGRGATRSFAALALGLFGRAMRDAGRVPSAEAGDLLRVRLAKTSSAEEAAACALAIGMRGETGAVELLSARLATAADDSSRAACCVGLGLAGASSARSSLRRTLESARTRPALLREAAIGLALAGDDELTPALTAELRRAGGSASEFGILQALGVVGDERALDALFESAADLDRSAAVRARAVAAIGAVSDGRRLPWNDRYARGANYLAEVETFTDARASGIIDRR